MTSAIWVGQLGRTVLVFDPAVQLDRCPHVFLWSFASGEMQKAVGSVTRNLIRRVADQGVRQQALLAYHEWHHRHAVEWLAQESAYYDERRSKELGATNALERSHKQRLDDLGLQYEGVRSVLPTRSRRRAHCYACHAALDNSVQIECVVCSWILCQCGACGCGFSRQRAEP